MNTDNLFIVALVLNGVLVLGEMFWCFIILFFGWTGDSHHFDTYHYARSLISRGVFWKTFFSGQTSQQTVVSTTASS